MISKKLICLLQSLSPNEVKKFREFIISPYFNKSNKCIVLFNRLIQEYPKFEFSGLTNEQLHNELFSSIKYNDATIRHLFSDLLSLVEKFLIELNLNNKNTDRFSLLMDELYSRKVHGLLGRYLSEQENKHAVRNAMGSDYLLNKFIFTTQKFNYISSTSGSFSTKNLNQTVKLLEDRNKNLVCFFIIELIKGFDTLNLIKKKYNLHSENQFSERFLSYLDLNSILNFLLKQADLSEYYFILIAYQKLFEAFANFDNESLYFEFKKEIYNSLEKYHNEAKGYFFKKIVDYCILKRISRNKATDFDLELFTVYNEMLNLNLHIDAHNNCLSPELFRNILFLSLKIKKLNWANDFIVNYAQYLPSTQKNNLVNFCYSALCFEKGDFDKALLLINKLKLNNNLIKIDTKNLLLRIYYEMNHIESAFSLIYTYREFLRKTQVLSIEKKKNHMEFIKCTEQLLNSRNLNDITNLEILYKEISVCDYLLNKKWLLSKIDELLNRTDTYKKLK